MCIRSYERQYTQDQSLSSNFFGKAFILLRGGPSAEAYFYIPEVSLSASSPKSMVGSDRQLTPHEEHEQLCPQVQSLGPLQPQVDPQLHAIVE